MEQDSSDRAVIRKALAAVFMIIALLVLVVVVGMAMQFWNYWVTGS